jgi:hypothetical protein
MSAQTAQTAHGTAGKVVIGLRNFLIPCALVTVLAVAAAYYRLQGSSDFHDTLEYCLSSSSKCNDYSVSHSVVYLATGHAVCTQAGTSCLDGDLDSGDNPGIWSSEELRRISLGVSDYFPNLVIILLLSGFGLFICIFLLSIYVDKEFEFNKLLSLHSDRSDVSYIFQRINILMAVSIAITCFVALWQYSLFHKNGCDWKTNTSVCDYMKIHHLKINSINHSSSELSVNFQWYMAGCSTFLFLGVLCWAFCVPCGSAVVNVIYTRDHVRTPKMVHATEICANILLAQLMLRKIDEKQCFSESECAVCLEPLGGSLTDLESGGNSCNAKEILSPKSKTVVHCSCGHAFHYSCLHGWVTAGWTNMNMERYATCPVCRSLVFFSNNTAGTKKNCSRNNSASSTIISDGSHHELQQSDEQIEDSEHYIISE